MTLRAAIVAMGLVASAASLAIPVGAAPIAKKAQRVAQRVDPATHKAACDELALVLTPEDQLPGQMEVLITALFDQMEEKDRDFAALVRRYPGLKAAAAARVMPIMLKAAYETLPLYRADLSQFYQANLTTQEARQAAAFFRTPAAQAFIAEMNNARSVDKSVGALVDQRKISSADVRDDLGNAGVAAARRIPPEHYRQVSAFFSSPLGLKLLRLTSRKNAIDAKWSNYSPPGVEQEVQIATIEGILDHIAKTDPETAAEMRTAMEANGSLPKKKS